MEKQKALSASSIKSLDTCSWLYWCQYEHRMPQKTNEGALRGTIVHLIFELLLDPRHRKHYDAIIKAKNITGSPALRRLVIKHLKKSKILKPDNYEMCNNMILVGLTTDFFGKGGVLGEPEFRFELSNDNPKYVIRGYIDKLVFYDGKIKIVDYKSSKAKFTGDDLTANVQSMAYSLVGYKMFGAEDVTTEFIFLRFPRQPVQEVHPTKEQLRGFENYLAYIYALVSNFTEKNARDNMAAYSQKNKWLCKAGATWICPYMKPFKYYALIDEKGKVCRTSMDKDALVPEEGQRLVVKRYEGCPAFKKQESPPDEL